MVGERALWILIAVVLLFFLPPLLGSTFFFRDLYLFFYGKRALLATTLRHGELPLWDPLSHGGQPLLGEIANSAAYPFNLLFLILPALTAFNVLIVLQFIFCAIAAYFLARALGLSMVAAFACGVVYTFCGYVLSCANLLVLMQAIPWAPALLGSVHLLATERRRQWLVVAAISGALSIVAGSFEMTAVGFALAIPWLLIVPSGLRPSRRIGLAIAVLALSIGLALVQVLPAYEVIHNSSRQQRLPYSVFVQWSVFPQRLPELIVPRFFGPTDTLARRDYWGGRYELGYPYIISIYFGVSALLLAITGAVSKRLPRSGRTILVLLAAAGFVFSLGGNLPFFHLLYEYVPLASMVRFPVKTLQFAIVPVALLAAAGVDSAVEMRRKLLVIASIVAGVLVLLAIAFVASGGFRDALTTGFFVEALPPASAKQLALSLVHAAVAATLFAGAVASKRELTIAALLVMDLAFAGSRVNAYAPHDLFQRPSLAITVRSIVAGGGKLYRTRDPFVMKMNVPTNEGVWLAWWELQLLSRYTGAAFGIPLVFDEDYDGLARYRVRRMTEAVDKLPWPNRLNVLSAAGASAIVTRDKIDLPGVEPVKILRSADGQPVFVYRNWASRPLRFAATSVVIRDDERAFDRLAVVPFDPNTVILSEGNPVSVAQPSPTRVATLERSANEWSVAVDAPSNGYVVFAETWDAGWRARVDGRDARLVRADVTFSAVAVPAGHHVVTKVYRPVLPLIGLIGSILTALVLAFWRVRP